MSISNTVKDSARAVSRLDEYGVTDKTTRVNFDGQWFTPDELLHAVARNLGYQYARCVGGMTPCRGIKASDVRGMLIGLGASSVTLDHSAKIARIIRTDYTL